MHLLIVLQSHTIHDNQKLLGIIEETTQRYPGVSKLEISKRCVKSLINTANYALKQRNDIQIFLKVFDDHSNEEFLVSLNKYLEKANFLYEIESLEDRGILNSIQECYDYAKYTGQDLVYFAQDDYLYEETCIHEMILQYEEMKNKNVGKSVCVYPFNDPYRYYDHNIVPVRIVQGKYRHWRQSYQTACCFMVEHEQILKEWDLFESFYNHPVDTKMEDDTINLLFQQREHILITPIPSLALHLQYDTEKDPYIDWTILWNKFADKEIKLPEKVLLNVGSGKNKLNFACFNEFTEITVDADTYLNPDIVANILELDVFDSESVDVFWLSHTLEHIYRSQVPDVLFNINRMLKDNGIAIIIVPNLKFIAEKIVSGNIHEPLYVSDAGPVSALEMIYGLVMNVDEPFMYHKTGFTEEYASALLSSMNITGFVKAIESNLFILITKKPLDEVCVKIDDVMENFYNV